MKKTDRDPMGRNQPSTRDVIEGKWKQLRGKVKEQWGKLTDDEIDRINGNREQLVGRIQERYGSNRADVERDVDQFLQRHTV